MRELDSLDVERAKYIAMAAHVDQRDNGGKPRFFHVETVSRMFFVPSFQIVAYLHDTLEDSNVTTKECLAATFNDEVAEAVDAITRRSGEQYFDYIRRCSQNRIATAVKKADISHNLDKSRWPEMPPSYEERELKALKILSGEGE